MPRFGKRLQHTASELAADNVHSMFDNPKETSKLEEEKKLLNTVARTIRLIKYIDKKFDEINA